MATLAAISFTMVGGMASFAVSMAAFGIAVKRRSIFVAARCVARPKNVIYNPKPKHPSQDRGNPSLGWIMWVMRLTYDTMLRGVPGTGTRDGGLTGALLKVNLDGIVLLRFHHMCLRVCFVASVLYLVVVLPLYKTAHCSRIRETITDDEESYYHESNEFIENCHSTNLTDYQKLTLANIPILGPPRSDSFKDGILNFFRPDHEGLLARLYAVVFCAWIVTWYALRELQFEWNEVLAMRRVYYLEADHWGDRNEELYETLLRDEREKRSNEKLQRQKDAFKPGKNKDKDKKKKDDDEEDYNKNREPWEPHPEQRDTVPNVELYSILVGGLPNLPTEVVDNDAADAVFSRKQAIDWQLTVTTAFFDHCVPNQPGFSSSVAAVTILPAADQLTEAWNHWYRAASKLRRLRFIRKEIAERRKFEIDEEAYPEDDEPSQSQGGGGGGATSAISTRKLNDDNYDPESTVYTDSIHKQKYFQEVLGSSTDLDVENNLMHALRFGPEQTAVYSREFALGAANLAPNGCFEGQIRRATIDELLQMEREAVQAVHEANQALKRAQGRIADSSVGDEEKNDINDDEMTALMKTASHHGSELGKIATGDVVVKDALEIIKEDDNGKKDEETGKDSNHNKKTVDDSKDKDPSDKDGTFNDNNVTDDKKDGNAKVEIEKVKSINGEDEKVSSVHGENEKVKNINGEDEKVKNVNGEDEKDKNVNGEDDICNIKDSIVTKQNIDDNKKDDVDDNKEGKDKDNREKSKDDKQYLIDLLRFGKKKKKEKEKLEDKESGGKQEEVTIVFVESGDEKEIKCDTDVIDMSVEKEDKSEGKAGGELDIEKGKIETQDDDLAIVREMLLSSIEEHGQPVDDIEESGIEDLDDFMLPSVSQNNSEDEKEPPAHDIEQGTNESSEGLTLSKIVMHNNIVKDKEKPVDTIEDGFRVTDHIEQLKQESPARFANTANSVVSAGTSFFGSEFSSEEASFAEYSEYGFSSHDGDLDDLEAAENPSALSKKKRRRRRRRGTKRFSLNNESSNFSLASAGKQMSVMLNPVNMATKATSATLKATSATLNAAGKATSATLNVAGKATSATLNVAGKATSATLNVAGKATSATLKAGNATLNAAGKATSATINVAGKATSATLKAADTVTKSTLKAADNVTKTTLRAADSMTNATLRAADSVTNATIKTAGAATKTVTNTVSTVTKAIPLPQRTSSVEKRPLKKADISNVQLSADLGLEANLFKEQRGLSSGNSQHVSRKNRRMRSGEMARRRMSGDSLHSDYSGDSSRHAPSRSGSVGGYDDGVRRRPRRERRPEGRTRSVSDSRSLASNMSNYTERSGSYEYLEEDAPRTPHRSRSSGSYESFGDETRTPHRQRSSGSYESYGDGTRTPHRQRSSGSYESYGEGTRTPQRSKSTGYDGYAGYEDGQQRISSSALKEQIRQIRNADVDFFDENDDIEEDHSSRYSPVRGMRLDENDDARQRPRPRARSSSSDGTWSEEYYDDMMEYPERPRYDEYAEDRARMTPQRTRSSDGMLAYSNEINRRRPPVRRARSSDGAELFDETEEMEGSSSRLRPATLSLSQMQSSLRNLAAQESTSMKDMNSQSMHSVDETSFETDLGASSEGEFGASLEGELDRDLGASLEGELDRDLGAVNENESETEYEVDLEGDLGAEPDADVEVDPETDLEAALGEVLDAATGVISSEDVLNAPEEGAQPGSVIGTKEPSSIWAKLQEDKERKSRIRARLDSMQSLENLLPGGSVHSLPNDGISMDSPGVPSSSLKEDSMQIQNSKDASTEGTRRFSVDPKGDEGPPGVPSRSLYRESEEEPNAYKNSNRSGHLHQEQPPLSGHGSNTKHGHDGGHTPMFMASIDEMDSDAGSSLGDNDFSLPTPAGLNTHHDFHASRKSVSSHSALEDNLRVAYHFEETAGLRSREGDEGPRKRFNSTATDKWSKVVSIIKESDDGKGKARKKVSSGKWQVLTPSECFWKIQRRVLKIIGATVEIVAKPDIVDDFRKHSNYAVVTFTSRQAAVAARHCLADSRGADRWITVGEIPSPPLADAPVCNMSSFRGCVRPVTLSISDKQKLLRNNLAIAALGTIYFFYTIPLIAAQRLVSPERLSRLIPDILVWQEDSLLLANIFSGFIPALVWTGFFAICPPMFKIIANFGSNATSSVIAENSALNYFWWFMVVSAFTGPSLSTAVINGFNQGIRIGAEIQEVIEVTAATIPTEVSATWLNWLIVRVTIVLPTQYLLQLNTFIFSFLGLTCCTRVVRGGGSGGPVPYRIYVDSGVVMLCVFGLAPASPLISAAAFVYFLFCTPMLRWTMIFLYKPKFDIGGGRFPFIFDMCVSGMVVGQILLVAMMTLKRAIGPALCAFCPMIPTIVYRYMLRRRYLRAFSDAALLQTSLLDGWDTNEETSEAKREEFRRFLVDCHKAAYVPVCIASSDLTASITAEPAVVVPTDNDDDGDSFSDYDGSHHSGTHRSESHHGESVYGHSIVGSVVGSMAGRAQQPGIFARRASVAPQPGQMLRRASNVHKFLNSNASLRGDDCSTHSGLPKQIVNPRPPVAINKNAFSSPKANVPSSATRNSPRRTIRANPAAMPKSPLL